MPDVLSQGGDHEPSPWPKRLVVIAAVIVLAVIGATHLPHHRAAPARAPAAAIVTAPVQQGNTDPSPPPPPEPREPSGIIGPTLRWDAGVRLPLTGTRPAWFSPATGRRKLIGALPRNASGYQFARVSQGWVIQPNPGGQQACGSCAGRPSPVYFLAESSQVAARVGSADAVAPAAGPAGLWLTSYRPGADLSTAAGLAREVSLSGAALRPPVSLPAGYQIDRDTDRGLLLMPAIRGPGVTTDLLWNPATRDAGRAFPGVIAASARQIAWAPPCAARCQIHLLDLATGRVRVMTLRAGSSAASAAFSPDGGYLALQVSYRSGGNGGAAATELEVASAAGRLTAVPDTGTSSDALVGFGWPAAADRLVAEFSFTTRVQVASWRPGGSRLAVAVLDPGPDSTSLIVGQGS